MIEKLRKPTLFVAVLGAVKLVTDALGFQLLTNESINDISNGMAALATVVGILINRDSVVK